MSISRREMLTGMAGVLGVTAISGTHKIAEAAQASPQLGRFEQIGGDFSWEPKILKLKEIEEVAHSAFHYKGYG